MEEINNFIHLAREIGLINRSYYNYLPNATKCDTIREAFISHSEKNKTVTVELNDIYGMLALLGLGLCGALFTIIFEVTLLVSHVDKIVDKLLIKSWWQV